MIAVENKIRFITDRGDNAAVIKTIQEVYEEYKNTCSVLVNDITDLSIYDKCYSLFCYIIENIQYKEDEGNNQYVKTPARLLNDRYGDCKSMAILIASCLHCLGVKCIFRFVSFNERPVYTHTYIVVPDSEKEIIIDPVERKNGQPIFNYARPYKLKKDIYV